MQSKCSTSCRRKATLGLNNSQGQVIIGLILFKPTTVHYYNTTWYETLPSAYIKHNTY